MPGNELTLADRVAGALWGMLIADAIAMPVHWFYGGAAQIIRAFGKPVSGYRSPLSAKGSFPESIMALSSTGGAGRGGTSDGDIIGSVINHGKKQYWERGGGYHYHCTLQKGENTLEGEMVRLAPICAGGRVEPAGSTETDKPSNALTVKMGRAIANNTACVRSSISG